MAYEFILTERFVSLIRIARPRRQSLKGYSPAVTTEQRR